MSLHHTKARAVIEQAQRKLGLLEQAVDGVTDTQARHVEREVARALRRIELPCETILGLRAGR